MQFNQQLKTLREAAKLTQEELALRLNISRSAIAKWEQGKGMPSLEMLKSLALFFHVSIDALLGEEGIKRFEKRRTSRDFILLTIAIISLVTAAVSTTLFAIERARQAQIATITELIQVTSVTRINRNYTIKYQSDSKEKSFTFSQDLLSFRKLDIDYPNVSYLDFLLITHTNNVVTSAIIVDNPSMDALKGYQLSFEIGDLSYEYYYYSYYKKTGNTGYHTAESDIEYFTNHKTIISTSSIEGASFYYTRVEHTLYINNQLGESTLMGISPIHMDSEGINTDIDVDTSYSGIQHLSLLNFERNGYENRSSSTLNGVTVRDYISFDVTLMFVTPITSVLVKQYDIDDTLLEEMTVSDEATKDLFTIHPSTAYLKYYLDGNSRGRTLEVGESEIFFLDNGTPMMSKFELSFPS